MPATDDVVLQVSDSLAPPTVPSFLSSLLHRTRTGILMLLLVVLPLHSVAQLVTGMHGHRHMHTGAASHASVLAGLAQPLRAMLDRLHAAQDPRLQQGHAVGWLSVSTGPADGLHEHGGVFHRHTHATHDVVGVADAGDEPAQPGVTAFLAWLPVELSVPAGAGSDRPATATAAWRDRVVAPPLAPPRA